MIHLSFVQKTKLTALSICMLAAGACGAQTISGTIADNAQSPIPYASILVKETATGTTSNVNGEFELAVPAAGTYHVTFQSLGFEKKELEVQVARTGGQPLRIVLVPQTYKLKEIRVYSGNEDPAYGVMRKAIALAPYHQKQVEAFNSEIYIKASFIVNKIPEFIRKRTEMNGQKIEAGRRYTAESMNKIAFEQPNKYKHTVISSRSSFPSTDGNDPMGYINASIYDGQIGEIVTPLSPNAFNHYRFRYEGFFDEGPLTVNKIKVIPKRKSQQLLDGYLYIVEGLWCIHSLDLNNRAFWGDIRIRQVYTPVKDGIWMPATHHFDLGVAMMGTKADVTYAGSVKYLSVTPNTKQQKPSWVQKPSAPEPVATAAKPPTPTQKKLDAVMAKENPTNRDMAKMVRLLEKEQKLTAPKDTSLQLIDNYQFAPKKDTVPRDTSYWNTIRPIPLTADELSGFQKADSIKLASMANAADTTAKKNKSFWRKHISPVLLGHDWTAKTKSKYKWEGFVNPKNVGFNPVDGWTYHLKGSLLPHLDSLHTLKVSPQIGYAIDRRRWLGQLDAAYGYSPLKRGMLNVGLGRQTADYNTTNRPSGLVHMAYNLLLKENYRVFFERTYVEAANSIDLANGLRLHTGVNYQTASPLENSTDFSFYKRHTPYRANLPVNKSIGLAHLREQNQLAFAASLQYTPMHYYRIENGKKKMAQSSWPTFEATWKQGVSGLLGSNARWMQLEATIRQRRDFGLSSIDYMVNGGGFLQRDEMHFSAFKSFATFDTDVELKAMPRSFALLPNYLYHTNRHYLQGHFTYGTPFLALKHLPFFSNRLWYENLSLHHLTVYGHPAHSEIAYGLSRLFLLGEASVTASFENEKYHGWGVKLTWNF